MKFEGTLLEIFSHFLVPREKVLNVENQRPCGGFLQMCVN